MNQLLLADIIRTLCVPVALFCAAVSLRVAVDRNYRSTAQLCRFLGLAVLCLAVSQIAYRAIGHQPYWPVLLCNTFGLGISLAGTWPLFWEAVKGDDRDARVDD